MKNILNAILSQFCAVISMYYHFRSMVLNSYFVKFIHWKQGYSVVTIWRRKIMEIDFTR